MRGLFLLFVLLIGFPSFSQHLPGSYTNNQGGTKTVGVVRPDALFENKRLLEYQKEIVVLEDGITKKLDPKDIASYTVRDGDQDFTFDSIDGMFFALRLYSGQATLHKFLRYIPSISNPAIIRVYLIRKSGQTNVKRVEAMGFSRLITKKSMLATFEDCPAAKTSIEKDEIKIKDEEKLIEFTKFYETNCP